MKSLLSLLTFGLLAATASPASAADTRLFEMRVYYAKPKASLTPSMPASATTRSISSPSMA
jgi:hypothetical protein